MRVDDAHRILGLRLNVWTAAVVFLLAVTYIVLSARRRPGREETVEPAAAGSPATGTAAPEGARAGEEKTGEEKTGEDEPATGATADAGAPRKP